MVIKNSSKIKSKIIIKSKSNYIVSLAVGKKFYKDWEKFILPSWRKYCHRHKIGLLIIKSELIEKQNEFYKKSNWQKLLIPNFIFSHFKFIRNICYLDTDVIISDEAPNIFKFCNMQKINVISLRKNLPYNYKETISKINVLRRTYLNKKYPLNSAINFTLQKLYEFHGLKKQSDEFCSGVLVYNIKKFNKVFSDIFYKYNKNIKSITNNGEQTHLNYELQSRKIVNYIDYKFQSIWLFEMANYYPFLYKNNKFYGRIAAECIASSLINKYFLHFPGSWIEGCMWKNANIGEVFADKQLSKNIMLHLKKNYSGKALGLIKMI